MSKCVKVCVAVIFYTLLSFVTLGQDVSFKAVISQEKVGLDDYVELQYVLEQKNGLEDFRGPNLQNFVVLNQSQGTSSVSQSVNGKRTQQNFIITTYVLKPKKVGNFTIAPAKVKYNGNDIHSNVVTLQVVKESQQPEYVDPFDAFFGRQRTMPRQQQAKPQRQELAEFSEKDISKNIFIKVDVDKKQPYKGEQVIASYKLYTRLPMSMTITQLPSLNGFWSEDFELPKVPKPTEEIINGVNYQVFVLKKTALFPQQTGSLVLDAAQAEGMVRVMSKTKIAHPFQDDPFFSFFMDDPFFNDDLFSAIDYKDVPVKLSSTPVPIEVKLLPPAPTSFVGGVGQFTLKDELEAKTYTTDDVIEYKLIIEGNGNSKLIGLPNIPWAEKLGVAEPQVVDSIVSRNPNIISRKVITYFLNPSAAGEYEIPSVKITFFNPKSNQFESVNTVAQKITITQGQDLASEVVNFQDNAQTQNETWKKWIPWIFGLALILGLLLLLWFRKKKKNTNSSKIVSQEDSAVQIANNRLKSAKELLDANDPQYYETLNKALWLYICQKNNIDLNDLRKEEAINYLSGKSISQGVIDDIKNVSKECELALYSPAKSVEAKAELFEKTKRVIVELENKF